MAEWLIEPLDKRAVCQKRRRTAQIAPQTLDTLPAEWRELLARWVMSAADLASLRVRKLLTEGDRQQLAALQEEPALPVALAELLEWMLKQGEKGEQEGYL